nr:hypothetical protein [uncultured Prevotella sp.]
MQLPANDDAFKKEFQGATAPKAHCPQKNISVAREINALTTLTFLHSI